MADISFGQALSTSVSTVSTMMTIFYWLFAFAVIGLTFFLLYRLIFQYRHKVRVREMRGNSQFVIDDKLRIKKSNGMITWHLLKAKEQIPIAPDDCIAIGGLFGNKIVEAFRSETGSLTYIRVTPSKKVEAFEPITTSQRIMYRSIYKKINQKRYENWKHNLPQIASIGVMGIVVVMLIVFWGNLGEPLLAMADKQVAYDAQQTQQLKIINEIKHGVQNLESSAGLSPSKPPD